MDNREIARRRLHNQALRGAPCASLENVVHRLAAMQAQEFAYAKWSVAQRARAVGNAETNEAINDGRILRTHAIRPTWHFVLPADIRWLLALTAPRINALNAHYYRKFALDDAVFARS